MIYLYGQFIEFKIRVLHTHSKCRYSNGALCEICMGCCKFELLILVSVKILQYYFLFPLLCSLAYSYRFRLLISKFISPIIGQDLYIGQLIEQLIIGHSFTLHYMFSVPLQCPPNLSEIPCCFSVHLKAKVVFTYKSSTGYSMGLRHHMVLNDPLHQGSSFANVV